MNQNIAHITIVVDDYDKAIEFYTQKLHFTLIADTLLTESKRWVLVKPKGENVCSLLLAKGVTEEQKSSIGNQTGGRVFLFLTTDNFKRDYQNLIDHNIKIFRPPSVEEYGTVAVFEDIYGNLWDLIEPNQAEQNFNFTTILKIIKPEQIELTIAQLKILRESALTDTGIISFNIQQVKENPAQIIIWQSFHDEHSYHTYMQSTHFQAFNKLDLVVIEARYVTNNIQ